MSQIRLLILCACVIALLQMPAVGAEALTLSQCIERALVFAPAVEDAGANVDLVDAQRRETRAQLFPTLGGHVEYSQQPGWNEVVTNRGLSTMQAMADYVAFDGGRRNAQVRSARYGLLAAGQGAVFARSQIVFDTKVAFFDLLRAQSTEAELIESQTRLQHFAAILSELVKSGRSIPNDVLKARVAVSDTELRLITARQTRARAADALALLIGEDRLRADLRIADPGLNLQPPAVQDIANNPSLAALRHQEESSKALIEAAQDERYPTFSLALAGGFLSIDPPSALTKYAGASYGGVMTMPFYDGGAIHARIDQARAREHQLRAQIRQAELDLTRRLDQANSRFVEARTALQTLADAIPVANDSFALGWARFLGGGKVTVLEVLDSYNQAETMRLGRIDQTFAMRQAAADAALVTGALE